MMARPSTILYAAVARLLRPLVRVLLQQGVSFGVFADIAKQQFVEVATQEFALPGRKPSISRAAVITGLSRKEVLRVTRLAAHSDREVQEKYNRAVRVVAGWGRDADYLEPDGSPRALPVEGGEQSFAALVRKYSGDVPPRAILDELQRAGAVERLDSGEVRLVNEAYVPDASREEKLGILGTDVADLIDTIAFNLDKTGGDTRLQLKVAYDNLPREVVAGFRADAAKQGFSLLKKLDGQLSNLDRDANPQQQGTGRMRAGLAVFYFEEELDGNAAGSAA